MGPAAITLIVSHFGLGSVMFLPLIMLGLLAVFGPMLMTKPKLAGMGLSYSDRRRHST
jgi:hypothetical protein